MSKISRCIVSIQLPVAPESTAIHEPFTRFSKLGLYGQFPTSKWVLFIVKLREVAAVLKALFWESIALLQKPVPLPRQKEVPLRKQKTKSPELDLKDARHDYRKVQCGGGGGCT